MRDHVRLILLYKANDTSVSSWCGYNFIKYFVKQFCFHLLVLVRRGPTYFPRETEPITGIRFPLFTVKLDISVGGEYMIEGSLENADIWRAIKAGQG